MRNRDVIFAAITVLIVVGCSKTSRVLMITMPDDTPAIDIPMEMKPDRSVHPDGVFEVTSGKTGREKILLQSAPALFSSPSGLKMQRTFCSVLSGGINSGKVHLKAQPESEPRFSIVEKEDGRLEVLEGNKPVFVYNYGMQLAPGVSEDQRRSTYIHPIYDLKGNIITDDFPKDHYHHRGLSWMWPYVFIDGKTYDLWAIQGIRQVFEKWLAREVGPACATVGVKNAWKIDERKVMDEWVWVRVFAANEYGRAIDFCLTLRVLEPVQISGRKDHNKGYGGFCLRFAPREETIITTPKGVESRDSDLKKLPWADEAGKFGGREDFTGIAIFQHAGNPDFPTGWCLRHYGFLGVSWPGLEIVTLEPQKPLTLRFRIWVHNGNTTRGKVREAYKLFAKPPILNFID